MTSSDLVKSVLRIPRCQLGHRMAQSWEGASQNGWLCSSCSPELAGRLIKHISIGTDLADSEDCNWHRVRFQKLNPIQSALLPWAHEDCNIVLSAATSAGKTIAAEIVMATALARNRKALYLSPLKALTQEKYDDWLSESHPWSSKKVSIVTGDYLMTPQRVKEMDDADVILCTSEMVDSRTRRIHSEKNYWLCKVGIIVADEFHLLTMESRGDKLESGIMRFSSLNPLARLFVMSATMSNIDELARWLTLLNGKRTLVLQSDWRPCELGVHYVPYQARPGARYYYENERSKVDAAVRTVQQYEEDRFLVFVHSKAAGRMAVQALQENSIPCEFHSADLDKMERLSVEKRFRSGNLRALVATSTLAYGLNVPARRVIILGMHRGIEEVHCLDIRQEIGRSGRVGLDPRGDAYVLIPDYEAEHHKSRLETIPTLESRMGELSVLAFHVVSEVESKTIQTVEGLKDWYHRTFAYFQGKRMEDDYFVDLIGRMIDGGILRFDGQLLRPTSVGRVAAWMYFDPFDVAAWAKNFRRVFELHQQKNDNAIAWALGNIPTERVRYIPKILKSWVADFDSKVSQLGLTASSNVKCTAYSLCLSPSEPPDGWGSEIRQVRYDSERVMAAVSILAKMHSHWGIEPSYWEALAIRVKTGVGWDGVWLVQAFRGIGPKRAKILLSNGFNSATDMLENPSLVYRVLGMSLGKKVMRQAVKIVKGDQDVDSSTRRYEDVGPYGIDPEEDKDLIESGGNAASGTEAGEEIQ